VTADHSRKFTIFLSAVLALQAAGGLFIRGLYRDNTWIVSTYRGTDWLTLALVVPALILSMVLALRGSVRARIVWLGTLYYVFYNNLYFLIGTAYNRFFLVYVAIFDLSLLALAATLMGTDIPAMGKVTVPSRTRQAAAGIAIASAAILTLMWTGQAVIFVGTGKLPQLISDTGGITDIVGALDLTLIAPPLVVGAVWLQQSRPWGLVISAAMMVQCVIITTCLVVVAPFNAAAGIQNAWRMVPLWAAMGAGFLAGSALLLRILPASCERNYSGR
jgi:hypothetical protein